MIRIVKWFDAQRGFGFAQRGFGFIQPEDGSKDAFVHISAVEHAGLSTLREAQKVSYEIAAGKNGKLAASNLVVTD